MTAGNGKPHLWIISEVKPNERRVCVTPDVCKTLIENGFKISVEECPNRIVPVEDYKAVGCTIVGRGTWEADAPQDAIIFNLKELPESDKPLTRTHIYFAHCFKYQHGWKDLLARFNKGNGRVLDLEFLTDDKGRRVAAFGYMAGFCGAALGLDLYCNKQLKNLQLSKHVEPFNNISDYPNQEVLINKIKTRLSLIGKTPKVLVIGALGRCGTGSCELFEKCGIPNENIIRWDIQETKNGGPFPELLDVDILVNCIYLTKPIPPFLTLDMIEKKDRALSVFVDVSCDFTSDSNPLPIYKQGTTFVEPVVSVGPKDNPIDVISIDHLPSLLPLESSIRFAKDLLPTLLELKDISNSKCWMKADKLFHDKVEESMK